MKWVASFFSLVIAAIIIVLVAGYSLPSKTVLTRTISVHRSAEEVFAVIADVQNFPKWNRDVTRVEILPLRDGKEATRQAFKGGMRMTIITTESKPPTLLVRKMADDNGPFTGAWTYDITPVADGSTVALTEQADIPNPAFRVLVRLLGQTKYMDRHLVDLGQRFGESVTIR